MPSLAIHELSIGLFNSIHRWYRNGKTDITSLIRLSFVEKVIPTSKEEACFSYFLRRAINDQVMAGKGHSIGKKSNKISSSEIRKRVLLQIASSPAVLAPFGLGMTAALGAWAVDFSHAGITMFAGLAGLLISGGLFFSKWFVSGAKTAETVLREVEQEQDQQHQKALDALERTLERADNDPRPEAALRDLRALLKSFHDLDTQTNSSWSILVDIHVQMDSLFQHCLRLLHKTHDLWTTASMLSTQEARKPVLDQREQIIKDVQDCVKQVSHTLVTIQQTHDQDTAATHLQEMRRDLDESLDVARRVEQRMSSMHIRTETPTRDSV